MTLQIISYIAIVALSISYWFQIWKIHEHKEVRDLSIPAHIILAIGNGLLTYTAFEENSTTFAIKQLLTAVPLAIIVGQIFYHRGDRYHDDCWKCCENCGEELEPEWKFCTNCGEEK